MPPSLPKGQRYVPVEPLPAPEAEPEPLPSFAPAPEAFPAASGTTLGTPGLFYPSAGPTEAGWLYQQIQGAAFPGTANTWTVAQTVQITDAGTGADDPALRPTLGYFDHLTTATPVPGIGGSHTFRAQDSAGTLVEIAKVCAEITNVTPNVVDATIAFCVAHQGQMCEVMRVRGQLGKDATVDSSGVFGFLGGETYMRTYLRVQERFGMNGVTPVGVQTLPAAATDPTTTQALVNAIRSALIAFGLGQ